MGVMTTPKLSGIFTVSLWPAFLSRARTPVFFHTWASEFFW
jgi:hypothetical protein